VGELKQTDVTVILRTVGERTTELCRQLIEEQIPPENIFTISEVPFTRAVQRTFEIGLDNNLSWTVAIDADVLLAEDSISTLKFLAQKQGDTLFKFNPKMQDKFFRPTRYGGVHIYQTTWFRQASTLFDGNEHIRPETHIAELMQERFNLQTIAYEDFTAGLHDYEQYYRDIYRKSFVFANKHPVSMLIQFMGYWGELARFDADYRVALAGLAEGLAHRGKVEINIDKLPQLYKENRLCNELEEKAALLISPWETGEDIRKYIHHCELSRNRPSLLKISKHQGAIKGLMAFTGYYLERIGKKCYRLGMGNTTS